MNNANYKHWNKIILSPFNSKLALSVCKDPFSYVHVCKLSVALFFMSILCDAMVCSLPVSSVHGILQARILEWVVMPSSRGSSQPKNWTQVTCIEANSLPTEPPGKPLLCTASLIKNIGNWSSLFNVYLVWTCYLPRNLNPWTPALRRISYRTFTAYYHYAMLGRARRGTKKM